MRLLILLAAILAGPAFAADFVVLAQGKPLGTMTVSVEGPRRTIVYEVEGSRPIKSRSTLDLDARGFITRVDYSGKAGGDDWFERFEATAEGAAWETGIDKGASKNGGFYNALSADAEHSAILARALLAAPGGRLPLLPTGEATISAADRVELKAGSGEAVPTTLYLIGGLSRRPVAVWLDDRRELAARVAGVEPSVVRRDLLSSAARLLEVQEARLAAFDEALAREAVERPRGGILIRNANLFDAGSARMRPGTSVLILGDRIAAVAPDGRINGPPGARIVDAGGRALLPGLWDAHVHMFDTSEGVMTLASGVTAVRDMGNDGALTSAWRRRFDAGELIGPRLFTGAVIDGPSERTVPWAHIVKDEAELATLVDRLAAEGYRTLKLFNSLPAALARPLIERAHARGMIAGGHLPRGLRLETLVDAGIDESTHFDFFAMQFVGPVGDGEMPSARRLALLIERADRIAPASPEVARMIGAMARRGVSLDPTMIGLELLMRDPPGRPSFIVPFADRLPATYLRGISGSAPADPAARAKSAAALARLLALLGAAARGGVPIVAGGDGEPGIVVPRELELYVEAGMSPLQAIQTATINPARRLGVAADLGSIEAGKLADLILVDGDPARDVGAVRDVVFVMKGGAILDVARLNAHVGMRPSPRLATFKAD